MKIEKIEIKLTKEEGNKAKISGFELWSNIILELNDTLSGLLLLYEEEQKAGRDQKQIGIRIVKLYTCVNYLKEKLLLCKAQYRAG